MRRSRATGRPVRAYSAIGHAAGVGNYALAGLLAGSAALPGRLWPPLLAMAGPIVTALNLAAVASRLLPAR
jgi:hypothetical protein